MPLDGAEERPVRKALPEEPEGRGSESRPVHQILSVSEMGNFSEAPWVTSGAHGRDCSSSKNSLFRHLDELHDGSSDFCPLYLSHQLYRKAVERSNWTSSKGLNI